MSARQAWNVAGANTPDEGREAGFTLVELLATIGLLSLLSVILLGSMRLGLWAWERAAVHGDRLDRIAIVQSLLRTAIEEAYPHFVSDAATGGHVEFEGNADALRVLAPSSRALGKGGRSWWSLSVVRDDKRTDLVIVVTPELTGGPGYAGRKVLLPDVQAVTMSYFGKARSEREAGWRQQWRGQTHPPGLVRIQVLFPPGDTRIWPELVVAPRIVADVGCVYDLLTKRCRGR